MKNNKDDIISRVTELQFLAKLIQIEIEIKAKLKAEKDGRTNSKSNQAA